MGLDALLEAIGRLIQPNQQLLPQLIDRGAQLCCRGRALLPSSFCFLAWISWVLVAVVMAWRSAVSCLADWLICCWELVSSAR